MELNTLAQNAEITEKNTTPFMTPKIEIPTKKGRPPMSEEEKAEKLKKQKEAAATKKAANPQSALKSAEAPKEPEIKIDMKKAMRPVTVFISNVGVDYVGDKRATMTPDEIDAIAEGMGLVLDKYMPLIFAQYGAEACLCIALGSYAMRITAMKKVLEIERAQNNPPQPPRPVQPSPEQVASTNVQQ